MALFVDKLRITNILVEGEVPREQAEEFAEAISAALQPAATEEEVEDKVAALDAKTDARFEAMMARMDARFTEMRGEMDARFAEMRGEMDARFAEMRGEMNARFAQFEVRIYRAIGAATALIIAAMSALAEFG